MKEKPPKGPGYEWYKPPPREHVARTKLIARIGHLIESGHLPRELADDLQALINMAGLAEIGAMVKQNKTLRAFTDAQLSRHHVLEELSPDELRRLKRDMADAIHSLDLGKQLVETQLWLVTLWERFGDG
jgi:hypothetical protein